MHRRSLLLIATIVALLFNSTPSQAQTSYRCDFNDLQGWTYEHQDKAEYSQCAAEDGQLRIFTRPNTYDRQKMHTSAKIFTSGTYRWRTYISPIAKDEQVSIGSWIYCDDRHELDFEVGYGTPEARSKCGAKLDELIACMTNQAHPYTSDYVPIRPGWHDFMIRLKPVNGKYKAQWLIDGKLKKEQQLGFGEEIAFYIYCSVENLKFLGSKIAENYNYGLFDYVKFKGKTKQR